MQVCLAGTGVTISDGATTIMPVGPHRAAAGWRSAHAAPARGERARGAHAAGSSTSTTSARRSATRYYQGWDLNPGQLPTRYAAVFSFFLESRAGSGRAAQARSSTKAAQATLLGNVFDDAATGQGLLNFFLRGINCGALREEEALATG